MNRKRNIMQIAAVGVENNMGTQCNAFFLALDSEGCVWQIRDVDKEWVQMPGLPPYTENELYGRDAI